MASEENHDAILPLQGEVLTLPESAEFSTWYRLIDRWVSGESDEPTKLLRVRSDLAQSSTNFGKPSDATAPLWEEIEFLHRFCNREPVDDIQDPPQRFDKHRGQSIDDLGRSIQGLELLVSLYARTDVLNVRTCRADFLQECRYLAEALQKHGGNASDSVAFALVAKLLSVLLQLRDIVDPLQDCVVCAEAFRTSTFPESVTASCQHEVKTCFSCLSQWVAASMEERGYAQLKCAECHVGLSYNEVREIASPATFQRYDDLIARAAWQSMSDFQFCLNPACTSGQVHFGGAKFECHVCGNRICVRHGVAWHLGETCSEYDQRRVSARQEFYASEELKVRVTRACPVCSVPIEKNAGCSHMNCSKCDAHFNWEDAAPYDATSFEWVRDQSRISPAPQGCRKRTLPLTILSLLCCVNLQLMWDVIFSGQRGSKLAEDNC